MEIINKAKEQELPVEFDVGIAGGYDFIIETVRESSSARTISFTNRAYVYLPKDKSVQYTKSSMGILLSVEVQSSNNRAVKFLFKGLQ